MKGKKEKVKFPFQKIVKVWLKKRKRQLKEFRAIERNTLKGGEKLYF